MVDSCAGRGPRFIAEKDDGQDCHIVAALSLRELLDRLDEIEAAVTGRTIAGPGHPVRRITGQLSPGGMSAAG